MVSTRIVTIPNLLSLFRLLLIPVFLVTFFLQNHLLRGVTFGTVKR